MPVNPTGVAAEEVSVMTAVVTEPAVVMTAVVIAAAMVISAVVVAAVVITATVMTTTAMMAAATGMVTTAAPAMMAAAAAMTTLRLCRRIGRAHHQAGYARGSDAIDSEQGACRCQVRQEFSCFSPSIPDHFISALAPVTLAPQESAPTAECSHSD
jgi:hypothetical protein